MWHSLVAQMRIHEMLAHHQVHSSHHYLQRLNDQQATKLVFFYIQETGTTPHNITNQHQELREQMP